MDMHTRSDAMATYAEPLKRRSVEPSETDGASATEDDVGGLGVWTAGERASRDEPFSFRWWAVLAAAPGRCTYAWPSGSIPIEAMVDAYPARRGALDCPLGMCRTIDSTLLLIVLHGSELAGRGLGAAASGWAGGWHVAFAVVAPRDGRKQHARSRSIKTDNQAMLRCTQCTVYTHIVDTACFCGVFRAGAFTSRGSADDESLGHIAQHIL